MSTQPTDTGIPGTVIDALSLLTSEARHWLPIVAGLSMVAAAPEAVIEHYMPDPIVLLGEILHMDSQLLMAGLGTVLVLIGLKLVIELLALMLAFVILADLSAGRRPDLAAGLLRLASWKLQFAWIVAGLFEQAAISGWFLGGTLLLLPLGLVTTVAYEEDNGFQAFPRAVHLGLMEMGPARPGFRIAVAVALGFFAGFVINTAISVVSFASSAADAGPGLLELFNALQGGQVPSLPAPVVNETAWAGPIMGVLLAPIAMLPTVFMIVVQQMTYWKARAFEAGTGIVSPSA